MTDSAPRSKAYRLVTAAVGLLFAGLAIAIVAVSERTFWPSLLAFVVGVLGIEAVVSACRGRTSLLSRIGPLP
ncbi:MAG: hypothetical protein KIT58_11035 [Planctomycetota bacterium]|nr:hypothetical protein [Planctomycetota bacterium]